MAAAATMLVATLVGLPAAPAVAASELLVPSAFATIQGAIDSAAAGDAVIVAPGTYHEHLDFKGKNIEVRSSGGPASTTIDGDGTSHVVRFHSGEGRAAVLRGFTITHGLVAVTLVGGGVAIENASPTIIGNVVTDNDAGVHAGAGIGVAEGSPLITDNQISGNHAEAAGAGGGVIAGGDAEVVGNVIEGNSAGGGGGVRISGNARLADNVIRANQAGAFDGGGVSIGGGHPTVLQNLIAANTAEARGGGVAVDAPPGASDLRVVVGNTIVANVAPEGSGVSGGLAGTQVVNNLVVGTVACSGAAIAAGMFHHNDVYAGGPSPYAGCSATDANLSADPLFKDPSGATPDYRLRTGSPAIDAGDMSATALPDDLQAWARVTDGDGDGSSPVIDMGAYEAPRAQRPQMPYTVWAQPSGAPLDGLGSWVDVLTDPTPTADQRPPTYLYGHYFGFVDGGGALGLVGLVGNPAGKSVVFGVVEANGTQHALSLPFDWVVGRPYFTLVYQAGPGAWAAWVFDSGAGAWTLVGVLSLPASWGKLAPASITALPWLGGVAGDCGEFPRADVLFYPPVGYVGATVGLASESFTREGPGGCPAGLSKLGPWTRYQMGA